MSLQKGVLLLSFFLFLLIIMTGFIDLPNIFSKTTIDVLSDQGISTRVDLDVLDSVKEYDNLKVYRTFSISFIEFDGQVLQVDVENDWLEFNKVDPNELMVFYYDTFSDSGLNSFTAVNFTVTPYAVSHLLEITPARSGTYEILGPKRVLIQKPELNIKPVVQIILASVLFLVLLAWFMVYQFKGRHKDIHDAHEENIAVLSAHVRKMMLAGAHEPQIKSFLRKQNESEEDIDQTLRRARFF